MRPAARHTTAEGKAQTGAKFGGLIGRVAGEGWSRDSIEQGILVVHA
jgi:hypothetical protein